MRGVRAVLVLALAACPASTTTDPIEPVDPEPSAHHQRGAVVVGYQRSEWSPRLATWFESTRVLEGAAQLVNAAFVFDTRIDLIAADCGRANAYYDPHTRSVTLCHELIALIATAFDKHDYLRQLLLYVAMHELGHALIDVLDLPVVGREEDAADQFAALFFVNTGDLSLIMGGVLAAQFFRRADADQAVYWDNHQFGEARYYQLMCLIYGGAPDARDALAPAIPSERADACPAEYRQIRRGWNRLLVPHRGGRGATFVE